MKTATSKKTGTFIGKCPDCRPNVYQDTILGDKMRLFNRMQAENKGRCTVCSKERQF